MTTADAVESSKPAPDLVERALEQGGVPAERAVFVGDALWDVHAALKAGVGCVAVLSGGGFSVQEFEDAGAHPVYEGPAELLGRLDGSPIGELARSLR
jgi:phosphoglycolate phosphatase-like HAD superfamily hydrolase